MRILCVPLFFADFQTSVSYLGWWRVNFITVFFVANMTSYAAFLMRI